MNNNSVWFITGCSTGFGRELAKLVLTRGWHAVITARDISKIQDIVKGYENQCLALKVDVTQKDQIHEAVKQAEQTFGCIDVVVNNAGYGYLGAIEESEEQEVRDMFETNFFGLAHVIHEVLPGMRKRGTGHIVNISSIGGITAFPSAGYYCATKFAVEGLSEALAREIEPLGLKVTVVEPGPFRTEWAGRSIKQSSNNIQDYAKSAGMRRAQILQYNGQQPGDPARAAKAIVQVVESENPPAHLVLGEFALEYAKAKLETMRRDFDTWAHVSLSADFPKV